MGDDGDDDYDDGFGDEHTQESLGPSRPRPSELAPAKPKAGGGRGEPVCQATNDCSKMFETFIANYKLR